jgi:predicted tellurium resistance membrane protein TerC
LAMTLPNTNLPHIGGMDGGKFLVIFAGGLIGVIIMRFAATLFVKLLHARPGLEIAAFVIVGWVGVKLAVLTLGHRDVGVISYEFAHSTTWKLVFYTVLIGIAAAGWFLSKEKEQEQSAA